MSVAIRNDVVPYDPPYALADAAPRVQALCLDCESVLAGHYCHECGARRADERPLTIARFRDDLLDEVSSLDSVTFQSLRDLFAAPGRLTVDYLAGRSRRYLSPLRMYLLLVGVLTFVSGAFDLLDGARRNARAQMNSAQVAKLDRFAAAHADGAAPARESAADQITARIFEYSFNPWLRLLDPLVVAGLLALLYRGRRRGYAEHLVLALHVMAANAAFSLATMAMHDAAGWAGPLDRAATALHWGVLGAYFFVAARLVHGETRARTAAKTVAFLAGSQAAMIVVPALAALAATLQVLL